MFEYKNMKFELIKDEREVFDQEVFEEKYTEVLDKYEYVVGDFAGENLRLNGFYEKKQKNIEKHVSYIEYYIHAHCAYGAPYYIIKKTAQNKQKAKPKVNKRRRR